MNTDDHILVLAAGRGTRMGGPKVLMSIRDQSWWQFQKQRLDKTGLPQIWLVGASAIHELAGKINPPAVLISADEHAPMFDTVRLGLESVPRGAGAYLLPIDVPCPNRSVWSSLACGSGCAVPGHQGRGGHPVYLSASWLEQNLPDTGQGDRLDEMIRGERIDIEVDDPDVTINLNTPDDVEAWLNSSRNRT